MNRVDVIVPCHNYGHFLRACMASVLSQPGVSVRVLVIDDASTDDTAAVASQLAAGDERIAFHRHAANQGLVATKNEGLAWASSEYMMLLDADDVLTPGALFRAVQLMDAHPEVGFVYGRFRATRDPEIEVFEMDPDPATRVVDSGEWIASVCATGVNPVPQPTVVVRTRLQKQVGGYRPELPHASDMEMWLRLAALAAVGFVDAEQAGYRLHASNMHYRYKGIFDFRQRKRCFEILFSKQAHGLADGRRLRALAFRRLAEEALRDAIVSYREGRFGGCAELAAFALSTDPRQMIDFPLRCLKHQPH